jgi:arylsulfatase A-like enzyme
MIGSHRILAALRGGASGRESLFRPTWWFGLGLLSFWSFRALALREAYDDGTPFTSGDFIAFGWDLGLTAGLFALARLLVQPWASPRPRLHVFTRYAVFGLVVLLDACMRGADLLYCSITGRHFSAGAFVYMSPANLTLLGDGHNPTAAYVALAATAACMLALVLDGRAFRKRGAGVLLALGPSRAYASACAALLAIALPVGTGFGAGEAQSARFVPEAAFLRQWLVWRGLITPPDAARLAMPSRLRPRLAALGLVPQRPLDARYPLLRARLDATPFPYPQTAAAGSARPNLVFTLVEQLNHEFVHAFSGELQGVMPQVSALAQRMTMVTEYRSVTQPTIHALVASLCSIHGALPYEDVNRRLVGGALEHTRLKCLPEILRDAGYHTVYIQAGSNRFAGTQGFLAAHGFEDIYGADQLEPIFAGRDLSIWGVHDDALIEFAEGKIRQLEAERDAGGRPFFVMVQTLDMHAPGHPPANCPLPPELDGVTQDPDSRNMIRAVHCTDAALGGFGRFILDDPARKQRTVWAITGDHPSEPLALLEQLHAKHHAHYAGWSGRLPLLLHDPTHALPARAAVLSGHLDLAPTLLHILGISDAKNAMEGYSIFGERPKHPLLLGRMAPESVAIYRPDLTRSLSIDELVAVCDDHAPLLSGDAEALDACELLDWLRWQNALWKYKRIFPE